MPSVSITSFNFFFQNYSFTKYKVIIKYEYIQTDLNITFHAFVLKTAKKKMFDRKAVTNLRDNST